jgi:hypothetical protein
MTTLEAHLINSINNLQQNLWFPSINIVLLIISAGLIAWYAWEARRTANKMEEQNELQLLPYFNIEIRSTTDLTQNILLNIGKGIALNINFENNSERNFPEIAILKPGEEQFLSKIDWFKDLLENKTTYFDTSVVTVFFDNIKGQRYSQKIIIKNWLAKPQKVSRID